MKLRWYIVHNNDPEDNSSDKRILQITYNNGETWEDVPEVFLEWRR